MLCGHNVALLTTALAIPFFKNFVYIMSSGSTSTAVAIDAGPAARLQAVTAAYQALQTELQNAVDARQRRETQLTETNMVKQVRRLSKPSDKIMLTLDLGPSFGSRDRGHN